MGIQIFPTFLLLIHEDQAYYISKSYTFTYIFLIYLLLNETNSL